MNEYKLRRDIQARIDVLESIKRETARDIKQLCPDNYMRSKAFLFLAIALRAAVKSLDDIPLGVSTDGESESEHFGAEAALEERRGSEPEGQLQEAETPKAPARVSARLL